MPSFYGENPPDTEVGSTDATESQISEDAVTETDTSGGFYQGSPEQTTTEAYEADARTARDAALAAQEAAEDAQEAAEASESAASSSESNAASSQSAAATSATNASNSASAAAGSATTAATQASNASTSASEAASSASAAASSESAAASSQSAAASSQTAAAGSATAAASSAGTASTKASEAAASATNAAASESAAASSESNASTSASQAATSATNAAASESAAASSETNAASSASAASTSASNAASSASAASSSATAAASSASSASTSATAAGSARDAALAALDSFDDRYLGQKSSEPSVDNDGNALVAGALYFDTVNTVMKVYDGSQWLAAYASVSGALLAINNLDDVSNTATARSNLGLGTAAEQNVGYFATAAQGSLADSALQNGDNVSVLTNDSGYLTGNETITLTGDVSGSGTTSISVTIADDSHNHVISNVDGLQAALDAKQDASTALTTSNYSTTLDGRYYTETEVGTFFSGSSAITGYNKTNWDTAYGWGNHASAGYLTGNQTITLTGDVSGSGTTSIAVTIADDSHNHIISNVDGLQTALDSKYPINSTAPTNLDSAGQGIWRLNTGHTNQPSGTNYGTLISFDNVSDTGFQIASDYQGSALYWRAGNGSVYGGSGSFSAWRRLWHDGNDGSGSGLDADLLDGVQGASFLRSDADDTFTGNLTTGANNHITFGPNSSWGSSLRVGGNGRTATGTEMASIVTTDGNVHIDAAASNNGIYLNFYAGTAGVAFGNGASGSNAWVNTAGNMYRASIGSASNPYWHAANDGSGSGLDADLLDGYQLSGATSVATKIFNNKGQNHSTYTDFNTVMTPGPNYLQQGTNGPTGTASQQFYGFMFGLGNEYGTSTGSATNYASQMYYPRAAQGGSPYLYFRDMESGAWGSWRKVYAGYADNADLLDGLNSDTSAAANTIVARNGSGHIYGNYILGNYFNATSGNSENPAIGQIWTQNTTDNYLRKSTPAHVISQLGLWTSGNDGSGSGLDADLLDGYQHTSFWKDGEDRRIGVLRFSGEGGNSGNGVINYGLYQEGGAWSNPFPDLVIGFHTGIKIGGYYGYNGTRFYNDAPGRAGAAQVMSIADGDSNVRIANTLYIGSGTAWHSANDGSGSGLDADTLDGNQSSFFADKTNQQTFNAPLNINGGAAQGTNDGTLYVTATNNNDWGLIVNKYNSSAYEYGIDLRVGSSATYGFRLLGNGGEKFRINGTGQAFYQGSSYWHALNDGSGSGLDADTVDGQHFTTSSTPTLGGLTIGTTSSGDNIHHVLQVGGDNNYSAIRMRYGATERQQIHFFGPSWSNNFTGGSQGAINLSGYNGVTFGAWNSPRGYVDSSGNAGFRGNVTAYAYSDIRLKHDVRPIFDDPLSKLMQLRGVRFDWDDEYVKSQHGDEDERWCPKHDVGMIAQEVQEVLPEITVEQDSGYLAVRYEKMIPLLVESIKQQQTQIEALVAEIESLKEMIQ